ncbi:glycosyltransferase family 4 protein [Candidatus Woesebacteria bacterium]|nr:glycosyltransferase family 4 protein [Candidatus Woesebacteria bacterium]
MTTYIIRASHANQYELQNYEPIAEEHAIKLITSRHPLTTTSLPTIQLWSPTDLPTFPFRKQILNRLIGGEQWLLGLENLVSQGDILHTAETYTPYTHQAVQLRRANKIKKLVCTCWETIPHNNEKFSRLRQWKKEAYQYVDIFHTPTERAKVALIKEGVNPKKIKVINYGVNLNHFKPPTKRATTSNPIVLTVARRVPEKGIDIWNQLGQEFGGSIDFKWIDSLPYKEVIKEYQKADIFLLPSMATATWEEQYGMALVEAMACGLPIITTNTGAITEVVDNAAVLCDPEYYSIRSKLVELINSPALIIKYQKLSIARARSNYDRNKQSVKLSSLYN